MNGIGWIKLHRQVMNSPLWTSEPFTRGQAWVDLILLANYDDGFFYKRGNKVQVKRGQVGVSVRGLADRWKWSRGKVNRFLNDLEEEQQIEPQKSNLTSLITITNYNHYQETRPQTEPQTGHRRATDGPIKRNKEEQDKIFEDFWEKYHEITSLPKTDKVPAQKHWHNLTDTEQRKATENIAPFFESLNGSFCKKARTYLSAKSFNDEFKPRINGSDPILEPELPNLDAT